MAKINIQFTLFSAFYSPLILTMSGGFLKEEGLDYEWSVAEPGKTAVESLVEGTAEVVQTAPSQSFGPLSRGETTSWAHFAQINEMDGFFISGREADPDFTWEKLEGAEVLMFADGQPNAMFRYACHKAGINYDQIKSITPGGASAIDSAFRDGQGEYVQQQGPFPQQLHSEGIGYIVSQVGPWIGPNAFSSLAAKRDWLQTGEAKAFSRAYRKTRIYINEAPAAEIAAAEQPFFPDIDHGALVNCINTYQKLGCWTPHPEITREAFDVAQDVFVYFGSLNDKIDYDKAVVLPPA